MIVKTIVFISIAVILFWKDPAVATDPEKTEVTQKNSGYQYQVLINFFIYPNSYTKLAITSPWRM